MRRAATTLAAVVLSLVPVAAMCNAPATSPVPMPRPMTPPDVTATPDGSLVRAIIPQSRPRPDMAPIPLLPPPPVTDDAVALALRGESLLAPLSSPVPPARNAASLRRFHARAMAPQPPQVTATRTADGSPTTGAATGGLCGMRALEGRELARITSPTAGCGIAAPVSITRVHGVQLVPPPTVDCDTARAFATWVERGAQPALARHGGGLVQMRIGSHFACRTRNNRAGAQISEHGRGRAIDIMSFRLANGETVRVLGGYRSGPYSAALRQMHRAACGIFRTTLGPGSDRFHEDHFHYDLARHARGGTYCR